MNFNRQRSTSLHRFAVYLPDQDSLGKKIEEIEVWIREGCYVLATVTGGATRLPPASGMWLNRTTGQLIEETTHVICAFFNPPTFFRDIRLIEDFIRRFGQETLQESVMVELDNKLYFITEFSQSSPKEAYSVVA
jgi:hypothetical protein